MTKDEQYTLGYEHGWDAAFETINNAIFNLQLDIPGLKELKEEQVAQPKQWVHAKAGAVLSMPIHTDPYVVPSPTTTIYYRKKDGLVTELCLGDRYAHVAPGAYFDNECYRGSYIDNWHGGPETSLTDIALWVANAEYKELGYTLWMKLSD